MLDELIEELGGWPRKHSPPEPVPASPPPPHTDLSNNAYFLAGVANFEPVYWNMNATIAKVCEFIEAAGQKGVKLLVFPEGAVSGYPWFNWFSITYDMEANEHINQLFIKNSPQIGPDGGDLKPIMECARKARVNVALPINERDNKGTQAAIFNSLVLIDLNGNIVLRHRKTVPSYTERMWWSHGTGDDLYVVDMPEVGKVCGLLCWENYLALARYTLNMQGCQFWVAPTQDIGPHWVATAQMIARENRAYVLSTTQMFRPEIAAQSEIGQVMNKVTPQAGNWSKMLLEAWAAVQKIPPITVGGVTYSDEKLDPEWFMDGQALIAGPGGELLAGPVYAGGNFATRDGYYTTDWAMDGCAPLFRGANEYGFLISSPCGVINVTGNNTHPDEIILFQNVSVGEVQRKALYQDQVGNYARPDIWSFTWHNKPRDVAFTDTPIQGNGLKSYDFDATMPAFSADGENKALKVISLQE